MHVASGYSGPTSPRFTFHSYLHPGEQWDTTKTAYQQAYFSDHSKQLSTWRKEGRIKIGGRYSDKGMIILVAKDEEEAGILLNTDPAVIHKTFKAELFPLNVFYKGSLD